MTSPDGSGCGLEDLLSLHALRALPANEGGAIEAHVDACALCREELRRLRSVVEAFVAWPADVLRPSQALWDRVAERVAAETGTAPAVPPARQPMEPPWEQSAPGIECKMLANDPARQRVSMLVRLAPGADYPSHRHAGVEEVHLLHGELWIDDERLMPGDYRRAEPGTVDRRVWTQTGCTCLVITSTQDVLG